MIKATRRLGFGAIDGIIALAIVAFGFSPGSHLHHTISELVTARITLLDMAFGIAFIYGWRYCFILLKLYDKFATVSSRILTTFQAVTIMLLLAVVYYKVEHAQVVTHRAIVLTFLALYCYEINRSALSAYFLDLLAARDPRRALIIGSGRRAGKAWRAVRTRYRLSLKLIGFVDDRHPDDMPPDVARRYLGPMDDLSSILLKEVVDLVLIAMPIQSCYPQMQRAIDIAENAGVQVLYLEDIYSTRKRPEDPNQDIFRGLAPDQEDYLLFRVTKRLLDITGALLSLIVLSPLLLAIGVALRLAGKGPILFRQERYGHRRRLFTMLRFRTTEGYSEDPLSSLDRGDGTSRAPSATNSEFDTLMPLGKLLRMTSFEELPQLWNVLVGDMSLVGPRPMTPQDVSMVGRSSLIRRFSVRPGMTGLWQVNGRKSFGVDQWDSMDNSYLDKRSLMLDLKILVLTVGAVIRRSGAS